MTRRQKTLLVIALTIPELVLAGLAILRSGRFSKLNLGSPVTLTGSVLLQDADPAKQTPLPGVTVIATEGGAQVTTSSGPTGFFSLTLGRRLPGIHPVTLTFQHPNYKTLQIDTGKPGDQLYIARLQPIRSNLASLPKGEQKSAVKFVDIKNVRVRYSSKNESTMGIGSLAKQFSAANVGDVPCRGQKPCSPDGQWKATKTALSIDAGDGNEFTNVRVLCIAGPCAFTQTEPDRFDQPQRKITISVLNWSDTADFVVEADVSRTMVTNAVRISYPFIVGQTLSFALPPTSEGPTVEAELNGQNIIFPLGPALILAWGDCSVEVSSDGEKIFRCQAKPGYRLLS
jgi:hypothetical protein